MRSEDAAAAANVSRDSWIMTRDSHATDEERRGIAREESFRGFFFIIAKVSSTVIIRELHLRVEWNSKAARKNKGGIAASVLATERDFAFSSRCLNVVAITTRNAHCHQASDTTIIALNVLPAFFFSSVICTLLLARGQTEQEQLNSSAFKCSVR